MSQEIIDIGALANDGSGDPLRLAFDKINNNFTELYNTSSVSPPAGGIQFAVATTSGNVTTYSLGSSANLVFDPITNTIAAKGKLIPPVTGQLDLGSPTNLIGNLYVSNSGLKLGNVGIAVNNNTVSFSDTTSNATVKIQSAEILATTARLANTVITGAVVETIGNTQGQVILQIDESLMQSVLVEIKSQSTYSAANQSTTLTINRNSLGTGVKYNAYGTLFNGNAIVSYDVDVVTGFIRVKINPLVNENIVHTMSYKLVN